MAVNDNPAGQSGETGKQSADTMRKQAEDWQKTIQDKVSDLASQVQGHGSQLADMTGSGVREYPLSSLVGALLIGAALGYVIGRQS